MVGNMVSIAESPMQENSFWWRPKNGLESGLLPCELVEISPSFTRNRFPNGGSGTFHQLIRPRRGSMQSEAFSEPVFQKQGKLITFFRGIILPRTSGKSKRKKKVFQVDLGEYLYGLEIEVPQVVTVCSQFIELRGCVDGVYRLSGISSNIQRLRRGFDEDKIPDLFNDRLVLQDIHSVSSLLKLYFRELPSPVCTFHLYDQFVSAVKATEDVRLYQLRAVIAQLPDANYSTLDYLMKHLHRVSLHHQDTGMTAKNLAIVWAPNLLRCQSLEAGGVEALQGVAVQAVVTEYLIKYCHIIFCEQSPPSERGTPRSVNKGYQPSFPISSPMKLLTLEEAQRQAHTINKRNQITPFDGSLPQHRKKVRPWKRKTIFAIKERKENVSTDNGSKAGARCPCIGDPSKMSTTPGSAYWEPPEYIGNAEIANKERSPCINHADSQPRYWPSGTRFNIDHPVQFDIDMDADMETKTIPNRKSVVPNSPVILRCSRQGDTNMTDLSFREARSSLRDKFRKFALSPISSSMSMTEKMGGQLDDEETAKGQHIKSNVKRLDLHRNDSLEFIDASSSEDSEFEMSPSTKRSKFHNKVQEPIPQIGQSDIKLNYVTPMSIKAGVKEKVETKLLECDHNKTNIKVTLDITSENNESQTFVIKSFKKENKDVELLETDTHTKDNAQKDASNAIQEKIVDETVGCKETKTVPTLITSACTVKGGDDAHEEQENVKETDTNGKGRMERYKEERRHLLREKYKMENYLSPVERAIRMKPPQHNEKQREVRTSSDLKSKFLSLSREKLTLDDTAGVDNENDVKISRISLNKASSHCSLSRQSLPEHLSDPSTHPRDTSDTKVSTHKVVLRLSRSCPVQGQVPNSDSSSGKVNPTKDEHIGEAVNVKEMASVFEPKKKELKLKPNMTFIPPSHTTAVPPSPSKIKSMAAIFEQNR